MIGWRTISFDLWKTSICDNFKDYSTKKATKNLNKFQKIKQFFSSWISKKIITCFFVKNAPTFATSKTFTTLKNIRKKSLQFFFIFIHYKKERDVSTRNNFFLFARNYSILSVEILFYFDFHLSYQSLYIMKFFSSSFHLQFNFFIFQSYNFHFLCLQIDWMIFTIYESESAIYEVYIIFPSPVFSLYLVTCLLILQVLRKNNIFLIFSFYFLQLILVLIY